MTAPWLVAAALTAAASIHCVGMCGGFVLAATAGRRGAWAHLRRYFLLQLGKTVSYAFLGALAGALGSAVLASPFVAWGGRVLTVIAALALGLAGLSLLGVRGQSESKVASRLAPVWAQVTGPLLATRPAGFPLVVGMIMGFLPCPLVYAGLAAAAASGSAPAGAATLGGVALGTVPALAVVAVAGPALSLGKRRAAARVAGFVLLVAAAITLTRVALNTGHGGHAGHGLPVAAPRVPVGVR